MQTPAAKPAVRIDRSAMLLAPDLFVMLQSLSLMHGGWQRQEVTSLAAEVDKQ